MLNSVNSLESRCQATMFHLFQNWMLGRFAGNPQNCKKNWFRWFSQDQSWRKVRFLVLKVISPFLMISVFFRSHFSYGSVDTSAEAIKHDKTCTEACTGWHSEWWSETSSERRHCVDWWISSGASRQIEMGDGGDGLNLLPWWSWVLEKNGGQPTKQNGGFDWAKWWIWGFQKWCF